MGKNPYLNKEVIQKLLENAKWHAYIIFNTFSKNACSGKSKTI